MMRMVDAQLGIPFSIPILGEAFISLNNPSIFTTLDFLAQVRIVSSHSNQLELPIKSPSLRRAVARILWKDGISGRFNITSQVKDPQELDFLATAALLYLATPEIISREIPSIFERMPDKDFITLARALTSLSGGFVICRKGDGPLSLNGHLDARAHIRLNSRGRNVKGSLTRFSSSFPELADPFWHLVGHLALNGGESVQEGDPARMGRLMTLESKLLHCLGLVDARMLRDLSKPSPNYGGKILCTEAMAGVVVLTSPAVPSPPQSNRFSFTQEGIMEIE